MRPSGYQPRQSIRNPEPPRGRGPREQCRHFTGIQNVSCEAGIRYGDAKGDARVLPCLGEAGAPTCASFAPWTPEERAEQRRELERRMDLLCRGLSGCCEAPLDESQIIVKGRHKGHGPRYCSKCGELVAYA